MLKITKASHLDHGLTEVQIAHIRETFADRTGFFIETITLPADLGTVSCALYGPAMGDLPVKEIGIRYEKRGTRSYFSRHIAALWRPTRLVTVIAGPHESDPCVLYTAFGGPLAPKEPGDPTIKDSERAASEEFWNDHALAIPPVVA